MQDWMCCFEGQAVVYKKACHSRITRKMDLSAYYSDMEFNCDNYSSDEEEWETIEKNFCLDFVSFGELKCPNISVAFFFALLKLNFSKNEIQIINEKMTRGYISVHELENLGLSFDKIAALIYLLNPEYAISNFTLDMEIITLDEKDIQQMKKCAICCENFAVGIDVCSLTCMHFSHKKCIVKRLVKYLTCPVCKTKYEKYPELIQKWIDTDEEAVTFLYKILHRVSGLICIQN